MGTLPTAFEIDRTQHFQREMCSGHPSRVARNLCLVSSPAPAQTLLCLGQVCGVGEFHGPILKNNQEFIDGGHFKGVVSFYNFAIYEQVLVLFLVDVLCPQRRCAVWTQCGCCADTADVLCRLGRCGAWAQQMCCVDCKCAVSTQHVHPAQLLCPHIKCAASTAHLLGDPHTPRLPCTSEQELVYTLHSKDKPGQRQQPTGLRN